MSQTTISEIEEKYNKRKIAKTLFISFVILVILIYIILLFTGYNSYLGFVYWSFFVGFFLLLAYAPDISEYESMRYHLTKLIKSLEAPDPKKSEEHIDKLVLSIDKFDGEIEDSFLFLSIKSTIDNLWTLLKYQIYPCLKENDYNSYLETLKDIKYAFDNENLIDLTRIIDQAVNDVTENYEQRAILLPHEQPYLLIRYFNDFISKCINLFNKNLIFRFISLSIIFLFVGYCTSIISSFVIYDFEFCKTILIVSGTLAVGWGIQKK